MTTLFHAQCVLTRKNRQTVSWVPRKIARIGNKIRLKEDDGSWSYWVVRKVGHVMPSKKILERRNAHKNMRKMTDI